METIHILTPRGKPTARRTDPLGINVADLDASIAIFEEVLDATLLHRAVPFEGLESDWMTTHLGAHPRTSLHVAMLRLGPTMNIELLSFDGSDVDLVAPAVELSGGIKTSH